VQKKEVAHTVYEILRDLRLHSLNYTVVEHSSLRLLDTKLMATRPPLKV